MKKDYNTRVEGNPYLSLVAAIVMQARNDAEDERRAEADRADALRGIEEWRETMEFEVTLSDTYLHDREHGIRI